MSYAAVAKDPCRIESDSEDEKRGQIPTPIITRRTIPKTVTSLSCPKTPDWDAASNRPQATRTQSPIQTLTSSNKNERGELASRISSSSSSSSSTRLNNAHEPIVPALTTPEPSSTLSATANTSNFDPIALLQNNLMKFINTVIPQDYSSFVQCTLRRDKDGLQGGLFPTFYLHAERPVDGKKCFLLAARKVAKVKRQSEYLITTDVATLSEKSAGEDYVGKLRGNNVTGTEYTLYDHGLSPNKVPNGKISNTREGLRRELLAIVYNTNILGFKGPRQMNIMIPKLGHDIQPAKNEPTILEQWRDRRFSYLTQLRNKAPSYNEDTKNYVLKFTGNRVAQPSVKNFQIVLENDNHEEEVVMQFGRVNEDIFTCDFRYPLTAIQAFGIALSSFDSRLARE
ncbi:unnamed protein product [Adineta ricciae]|uniref:Tubby C-terminal domain-containing protein n=1 Tax=Adineta ricciae TaxID=249248 RepID=A0A815VP38_ADIRI|nr:unnamed protein product [Adineta ricciae]CAF1532866.1 unnamed protein product [Adineta ricciae]